MFICSCTLTQLFACSMCAMNSLHVAPDGAHGAIGYACYCVSATRITGTRWPHNRVASRVALHIADKQKQNMANYVVLH